MQTSTVFTRSLRSQRARIYQPTHRQKTDWTSMSNNALKYALDVLTLHDSPQIGEVLNEIMQRIEQGQWMDTNESIVATENLPAWIKVWPFCLLWKQRPR